MSWRPIAVWFLCLCLVGCGQSYEKGVNKGLDKPVPSKAKDADKK